MVTSLSLGVATEVLRRAGVPSGGVAQVRHMESGNDVFRLDVRVDSFFLKIPTKDLAPWPDPLDGASVKVRRECFAFNRLREHGIASVEVVGSELDRDNPIGHPYLLTRQIEGIPFTDVVPAGAPDLWRRPLEAVGEYLAAVHRIELETPGYLGLSADRDSPEPPGASHHPEAAQAYAMRDLDEARPDLSPDLVASLEKRFGEIATSIAGEYQPPRFVIGGFHPNHPFLEGSDEDWCVTGCVDLEGASGGSVFDDLATFAVGMMSRFEAGIPWWQSLFEGYGAEPSLERFRTELLSSCSYWFGASGRTERLEVTYRALLEADSWATLFGAHRDREV